MLVHLGLSSIQKIDRVLQSKSPGSCMVQSTTDDPIVPVPLLLTKSQAIRLQRNSTDKKGTRLRLSESQIRHMRKSTMDIASGVERSLKDVIHNFAKGNKPKKVVSEKPKKGKGNGDGSDKSGRSEDYRLKPKGVTDEQFSNANRGLTNDDKIYGAGLLSLLTTALPFMEKLFSKSGSSMYKLDKRGVTENHRKEAKKNLQKLRALRDKIIKDGGIAPKDAKKHGGFIPVIAAALPFLIEMFKGKGVSGGAIGGELSMKKMVSLIPMFGPIISSLLLSGSGFRCKSGAGCGCDEDVCQCDKPKSKKKVVKYDF